MDQMMPQQTDQTYQTAPTDQPGADDQGWDSVELEINRTTGEMKISVESNDVEGDEGKEMPVDGKAQALKAIGQIIDQILSQVQAPAVQQEDQAYKQEMAA